MSRMELTTVDRLVSEFAAAHKGQFRIDDLEIIGVTAGQRRLRLESERWYETYSGVYRMAGAPRTWAGDLLAACWAGGPRAVASHRSAAWLWELPGSSRQFLELTCPRWRRTKEPGLVVHETTLWAPEDASQRFGVPVTSVERTLADLASVVSPTSLDLALDRALRLDLTDLEKLQRILARLGRRGRPGTQLFRRVIEDRSAATALSESERERLLFHMLRRHGFPRPVPQYEILDETGNLVARPDFAYPDLKIAIEYESFQEHTGKVALIRDSARRNAVVALGWAPIAATAVDLRRGGDQLADALRRARNRRISEHAS
jgi:hypothetical protein